MRRLYPIDPSDPTTWAAIKPCVGTAELLYRLTDRHGGLLYIGVTWNPRERWVKHRRNKKWWYEVVRAEIDYYPEVWMALKAETAAIKAERPLYNIRSAVR